MDRRCKTISKGNLINDQIRAKEVRLIDSEGNQLGVVSIQEARATAEEQNLDLVNISPNAAPPVCKIMDYGKYRYEQQKKEKEARKKQKIIEIKEIRLGIFTEEHDLVTKANNALKFLDAGDKVKISMRFRGREMGYVSKGRETMLRFCAMVEEIGTIEKHPILEGRNMSMVLAPKSEKDREKEQKEKEKIDQRKEANQNGEKQDEVPSGSDEKI
ncbi:MAG: translation initiation factor IF-3 [Clostridiales bacterium]|nr:translation initiation factor IF-3 [Clostridiales bacterium]